MLRTNFPDVIILVHRYAEEFGDLLGDLKVSDLLVSSITLQGRRHKFCLFLDLLIIFRTIFTLSH